MALTFSPPPLLVAHFLLGRSEKLYFSFTFFGFFFGRPNHRWKLLPEGSQHTQAACLELSVVGVQ